MKPAFTLFILLWISATVPAQATSSDVAIVTTYSENNKFYLRSVPYDDEFPTLKGRTFVYQNGNPRPIYVFDRGFDSIEEDSNNLILSNDGQVIFFAIPWQANEDKDGLKSITIYQNGKLIRSFTETEVTGCNKKEERCSLLYSNYEQVVDKEKSNLGTVNYRKTFKEGTDDKERFLSDYPIFVSNDIVYLTDSRKQVHLFDLRKAANLGSRTFDDIFAEIKNKGRSNRTELSHQKSHTYLEFPKLMNGVSTYQALARFIGMKPADLAASKDEAYKLYTFTVSVDILRDGRLEIEDIEIDPELPKEKIVEFFNTHRFDISEVPRVFDQWHLSREYFSFRKANNRIARQEKQLEIAEARKDREKRMTLESINGVYIPRDMGECFVELDKLLGEIDKKEIRALRTRDEMIRYHLDMGMWMRNNWSLWGGSRLYKYFLDKGLRDPEDMSSLILFYYYDWLTGQKENWKQWEKDPRRPFSEPADQRFSETINSRRKP